MAQPLRFNVGTTDRLVRVVLGIVLLVAAILLRDVWGVWAMAGGIVAGSILVLTAAFRFCPAYWPFGLSTHSSSSET